MKTSGKWLAGLASVGIALAQSAPPDAAKLFARRCAVCHGDDASGSDRAPALSRSRQLSARTVREIHDIILKGTAGGMPPFPLPEDQLQALAGFVRSMNGTAFDSPPEGDSAAGERFFFGRGQCASCHTALGRGKSIGPDLSNTGRQLTLAELTRKVKSPNGSMSGSYAVVSVRLRDGRTVRGFARKETLHSLQLETLEGRLLLLADGEYEVTVREKTSAMPPLNASPEEERNLIAFLSHLGGVSAGPLTGSGEAVSREAIDAILHPKPGEWSTYNGSINGNRHSSLDQINRQNVPKLAMQWVYSTTFNGLETTPLVADGVMYITGPNQVYALDARSGTEIWRYLRPRSSVATIAADAAKGANRGVALLGDRVFYTTDDAHLLCLDRLTGALRWDVFMPEATQHYGATGAPLVVGDLVVAGVAGADDGIRGFLAAYKATTGQLAWRLWTVPRAGEPGSDTWKGDAVEFGGGSTWLTGSYDPELHLLYWPTGNPFPDTDGSERGGDNLYPTAFWRSIRDWASSAGTSNSRRTMCTIGMPFSRRCWWTRSSRDGCASCCCTPTATASTTCSTGPTASYCWPRRSLSGSHGHRESTPRAGPSNCPATCRLWTAHPPAPTFAGLPTGCRRRTTQLPICTT